MTLPIKLQVVAGTQKRDSSSFAITKDEEQDAKEY